jgi:hypothetical protein
MRWRLVAVCPCAWLFGHRRSKARSCASMTARILGSVSRNSRSRSRAMRVRVDIDSRGAGPSAFEERHRWGSYAPGQMVAQAPTGSFAPRSWRDGDPAVPGSPSLILSAHREERWCASSLVTTRLERSSCASTDMALRRRDLAEASPHASAIARSPTPIPLISRHRAPLHPGAGLGATVPVYLIRRRP